ncbi:hypothetical protein LJC63_09605 [Ruminococcaceae bacterium OttesenSCG-928-L11]|nr:hypothetical protein [Ruminococcaceae bacterium OttesenSCG-928-L11]
MSQEKEEQNSQPIIGTEKSEVLRIMERENYYVLLELAFDPPVTDTTLIKAAMQKKRQEWIRMQDTPGKRGIALYNLSLLPDIERVMLNPMLRTDEGLAAVELRNAMLRQFEAELRIFESKGHITPREAASLTAKYAAYGITKEALHNLARVPVSEKPPQDNEEEMGETLDRLTARNIQRNLAILGMPDLYAFLEQPAYSSIKKLKQAAEAQRRTATASGSKTAQVTAVQELSGICLQLFTSFDSKQKYDRYLKISSYPAVGELIDDEYTRSKFINPDIILRIINFAVEKYGCKVIEAEEYIRRYCKAYDIPIDSQSHLIECPACHNKTDRDGALCTFCAAPLRGECPHCSTPFEGGAKVCAHCGFALGDMAKARQYLDDAETAILDSNWSSAQRCISYARRYWPGHPNLESLQRRAKLLEDRYASFVNNINDAVEHNQYYAARELVEEAENRRIRLPETTVDHIRKTLTEFEVKLEEIRASAEKPDYNVLYEMLAIVADSIELSRMLSLYPPEPVGDLIAMVFGRRVRLDWTKSPAGGRVSYVLVRKTDSAPLTAYDGDILYEGMAHSFEDLTAAPLRRHYYSVFVKRGNAFSETGTVSASVLIVPEVESLRIVPTDAGARISWDFNPDLREVQIWRKLGGDRPLTKGDGMLIENPRLDGYSDYKLKNDVEYWYYVVGVYIVNGLKVYSKGVCESVIPHKLLAPIDHFDIVQVEDSEDEYVVNWYSSQYTDVLMLASPQRMEYRVGETLPLSELLEQYRSLDMETKTAESARIRCSFSGGLYITAAAVSGKYATIGSSRYLIRVPDVDELSYDMHGNDIVFNMKWPEGIHEILVSWRFDGYPKRPGETGSTYMSCSRKQYEEDAGIVLREPEQNLYYVKIFTAFVTPDGEKTYSRGVEARVDLTPLQEVFYELKYQKSFFASAYTVTLTISSEEEFVLPRAVIVGKMDRLPLRKTDGMPLFEIEKETRVSGSITFEYRTSLLPKNLHVKMFLREEELYRKYRLLPTSNLKLT